MSKTDKIYNSHYYYFHIILIYNVSLNLSLNFPKSDLIYYFIYSYVSGK